MCATRMIHFALNIQMCKKMRRMSGVHIFPKYAHSISNTPSFTFCQIFVGYQIFDFWMLFELGAIFQHQKKLILNQIQIMF